MSGVRADAFFSKIAQFSPTSEVIKTPRPVPLPLPRSQGIFRSNFLPFEVLQIRPRDFNTLQFVIILCKTFNIIHRKVTGANIVTVIH